jgi:preprotein translocase subunit SecA
VLAGGGSRSSAQRHESRRVSITSSRRRRPSGDGHCRFYLSLQDDLLRIFGLDRMTGLMERLGLEEDVPIESPMVTRSIEGAQKKVEGRNFDQRKNVLEYDDVMNQQRKTIYALRRQILEGRDRPTETDEERRWASSAGRDLIGRLDSRLLRRPTKVMTRLKETIGVTCQRIPTRRRRRCQKAALGKRSQATRSPASASSSALRIWQASTERCSTLEKRYDDDPERRCSRADRAVRQVANPASNRRMYDLADAKMASCHRSKCSRPA